MGRCYAGQVRAARSRRERQRQAYDVMRGVADDSLVEIADLDRDATVQCSDRPQIARVTVSADPDRRPFRQRSAFLLFEPLVKGDRAATYIRMSRTGHLKRLAETERLDAIGRPKRFLGCHRKTRLRQTGRLWTVNKGIDASLDDKAEVPGHPGCVRSKVLFSLDIDARLCQ